MFVKLMVAIAEHGCWKSTQVFFLLGKTAIIQDIIAATFLGLESEMQ